MKMILIAAMLALAGCIPQDPPLDYGKEIKTRYIEIDGRKYLLQFQSNGHYHYWQIVAGPIP